MLKEYMELEVAKFTPMNDVILVDWEENTDLIKIGKATLIRPHTYRKQHYTGIVLKKGPLVDEAIKEGDRIFFEQFSGFEKFWDETYGRVALLKEAAALAIIPPRASIESDTSDYNYAA